MPENIIGQKIHMGKADKFDVIIVGAGPAGCTLALHLAKHGLKIAVFEKERFPRKKICGDALSGKVVNVLKRLPGDIYPQFLSTVQKCPSAGVRFVSPGSHILNLPFPATKNDKPEPAGYLCQREIFDHFLFSQLSGNSGIHIFEQTAVDEVMVHPDRVEVKASGSTFSASMIAGADGVHSVVRQKLTGIKLVRQHICLGIRGYYSGLQAPESDNLIELRFMRPLLPGYLWIFRGNDQLANVGIGIPMLKAGRINESLTSVLNRLISETPEMAALFATTKLVGKLAAHPLPLATYKLERSGDRFILLGDAGYMVDPFTGEGIGNAMGSAESAVPVILDCFRRGDYSARALEPYENRINIRFGDEFRIMTWMQRLVTVPGLMDLVVRKAAKNEELKTQLAGMFTDTKERLRLTNPAYYLKLMLK